LQSREADSGEALAAKDSQIGVLRIRMEEADKQIQELHRQMQLLSGERDRYVVNIFFYSFVVFL
jgi:hypothetical protein